MARPFILLGSVIFATLSAVTCLPAYTVPYIIGISAVSGILCLVLGIKLKFLKPVFVVFLAICLASTSYFLRSGFTYYPALQLTTEQEAVVTGTVKEIRKNHNNYHYILEDITVNNTNETIYKIRITYKKLVNASVDDIMTFNVKRINGYSGIPQFSMPDEDGVHLYAYSFAEPDIIKAENHSANYYLTLLRSFIANTLNNSIDKESAGAINAMLTGDKTFLSDETMQIFSHSGISHLFAVSGFHLSLWTSAIFVFFEKLNKKLRTFGNIFAIVFILFFMALTGFTPSVVRAGIMMLIFIAGQLTKYKADSVNSLFVALSFILLVNPYSVTSLSLQLSFLATLGIITLSSAVTEPVLKLRKKLKSKFLFTAVFSSYTTCMISLIATVFTCPVSASAFGMYSFLGPVTNILCLPVAQLILPLSSLGIATSFFAPVSKIFFTLCDVIMKYIIFVAEKISQFPVSAVNSKIQPVQTALFIILAATILFICFFERKNNCLRIVSAFSVISFLVVSVAVFAYDNTSFTFYVSSVGNGSATACNINGKKLVIGCGGEDYREYIFTDTLNTVSFREFDLLIIPDSTETESVYAEKLLGKYSFNSVVTCENYSVENTEKLLPQKVARGNLIKITIDENTNLLYINNDNFSGARIEAQDFTCTILFSPTSDFSAVPSDWSRGNLLISRQSLPETEIDFTDIIVSTDSVTPIESSDVKMTSTDGNITYTFNKYTGAGCYADK